MGFLYIILSVCCSLSIAQLLKIGEKREYNVLNILITNYAVAFIISFVSADERTTGKLQTAISDPWLLFLVAVLGLVFIGNMIIYSRSIHKVGMGISIAAMRTSLVFPIALSIFVYGEYLESFKYAGIILAFIGLYLMLPAVKWKKIRSYVILLLPMGIFLFTGIADSGLKIFEQAYSDTVSEDLFLSGIFLVSFLLGLIYRISKKEGGIMPAEIYLGIMVGIVNLYSSIFLLYALKELPGALVFPLVNVSLVVAGTIIGIWVWKDRVSKRQLAGLLLSIITIIILIQ